jgi:hypothetical protein
MRLQSFLVSVIAVVGIATPTAHALTLDEIKARLEAAGYSQVREAPSGKIKIFKAVKDGRERSIMVDSFGHIKELQ